MVNKDLTVSFAGSSKRRGQGFLMEAWPSRYVVRDRNRRFTWAAEVASRSRRGAREVLRRGSGRPAPAGVPAGRKTWSRGGGHSGRLRPSGWGCRIGMDATRGRVHVGEQSRGDLRSLGSPAGLASLSTRGAFPTMGLKSVPAPGPSPLAAGAADGLAAGPFCAGSAARRPGGTVAVGVGGGPSGPTGAGSGGDLVQASLPAADWAAPGRD